MEEKELLSQLNDSQRAAVEYLDGASLVIAGAGSGKTRVLTYKIAYLLMKGYEPWDILALTFTNKAAKEMQSRIGSLVGADRARYLNMGTFHSIFARILRREAAHIGYNPNFTIYDEADSRSLIKTIIKELQLDDKIYKPAGVHSKISMAKNHLIMPADYALDRELISRDIDTRQPAISQIYTTYQQRCQNANAMDFDDLLVLTYILFRDHEDVRRKYADHFRFILVDEYQDTNYAQQCIILQLTKENPHVCVVGDDYQSIYGFRGANIDNILKFSKLYANAQLFKLEQNYRSTQHIVSAANSLMKKNERQIPKDVFSTNAEGEKLTLKPAYSDKEEAMIVCKDIKRIMAADYAQYCDFAILYRTNSQSRSFEEEMRKQDIPYRIFGGLSFYQRKEIKDIIAYFRLIANPNDEEAFKRIINYPSRGIGNTTLAKIAEAARKYGVSFWDVICSPTHFGLNVNKGTLNKLDVFRALITSFIEKMPKVDAFELGQEIIKVSGITADIYSSREPEALSRQENLEEFLSGMQDFVEGRREEGREDEIFLSDFLQDVALMSDLDSDSNGEDEQSRVSLMTIHSAKGLEFSTVFIVGLEENIFPSPMAVSSARELEEERRLLYVAITRAEKHCILTCARNRWRYGKMEYDTPSRFLRDIDPALLNVESERGGMDSSVDTDYTARYSGHTSRYSSIYNQSKPKEVHLTQSHSNQNLRRVVPSSATASTVSSSMVSTNAGNLSVGSIIEHQRFGIGVVQKLEGTGENTKATVEFKNAGTKQLLLKFARFSIVG